MDEEHRALLDTLRRLPSTQAADWLLANHPVGSGRRGEAILRIVHLSWARPDQIRLARHYLRALPFANARCTEHLRRSCQLDDWSGCFVKSWPTKVRWKRRTPLPCGTVSRRPCAAPRARPRIRTRSKPSSGPCETLPRGEASRPDHPLRGSPRATRARLALLQPRAVILSRTGRPPTPRAHRTDRDDPTRRGAVTPARIPTHQSAERGPPNDPGPPAMPADPSRAGWSLHTEGGGLRRWRLHVRGSDGPTLQAKQATCALTPAAWPPPAPPCPCGP